VSKARRKTTSRRALEQQPHFDEISPEVGELDEDAVESALEEDPDDTLALLLQHLRHQRRAAACDVEHDACRCAGRAHLAEIHALDLRVRLRRGHAHAGFLHESIGQFQGGYGTLRDSLAHGARRLVRREHKPPEEEIWALKDVSFSVEQGEVLGVIGRNGAGKSTLLKLLTQITTPTAGSAVIRGRVGSLLEVGTGFHPELTGRENTFLNGAILGMKRREITSKFDEIVEFSGIGKPVI